MNRRTVLSAVVAVALAAGVGVLATRQAPAPKVAALAAPAAPSVQPKLLELPLAKALANQEALLDKADKLKPNQRLPLPVAHSAGSAAVAKLQEHEERGAKPASLDDAKSVALWFSGNEIGETDPCG